MSNTPKPGTTWVARTGTVTGRRVKILSVDGSKAHVNVTDESPAVFKSQAGNDLYLPLSFFGASKTYRPWTAEA